MPDETLGYTCACGRFNEADEWARNHWKYRLDHDCPCGRTNVVLEGVLEGVVEEELSCTN